MKKMLLATTAVGLFVAGGAYAATPTIKVGGYADAQVGAADQEESFVSDGGLGGPNGTKGGANVLTRGYNSATDTQLFFDVDGETDFGLKYGAHITLEADVNEPGDSGFGTRNSGKTYLYVENEAGRLEGGATTSAANAMQVGAQTLARATGGIAGDFDRYVDLDGDANNFGGGSTGLRTFLTKPGLINDVNPFDVEVNIENDRATANKLSYFSPDIYGLRLGLSFTPDTEERGTEKGFATQYGAAAGSFVTHFENVFDGGAHYKNQFNGVGVEASVTGQIGDAKDPAAGGTTADDLRSYNAGLNVSFAGVTLGGSYGRADEFGRDNTMSSEAHFWTAGASYVYGPFGASVTYLTSEIENDAFAGGANRDSGFDNIVVGADYQLAPGLVPYVEVSFFDTDSNRNIQENSGTVFISGLGLTF
jgi:predicted porin